MGTISHLLYRDCKLKAICRIDFTKIKGDNDMSLESARLFVQEVYMNKDIANKVTKIEDMKELIDFAIETGYDFGAEELKEVNLEFRKKVNNELSEEDLRMVIGGTTPLFPPCLPGSTSIFCQ